MHNQSVSPAHFQQVPWLLLGFIVVSLLVHGSTFLFPTKPIVQLPEQRYGTTIISAVLAPAKNKPAAPSSHGTAPSAQAKIKEAATPQRQATPVITRQPNVLAVAKTTQVTTTTANQTLPITPSTMARTSIEHSSTDTLEKPAGSDSPSSQELLVSELTEQRNYLLGELQNRLKHYLTYPLRARKRGWEGEVTVAFFIDAAGRLNNVRLTQSSGYSVLDHSALSAIGKLKHIDLPDRLGQLHAMEMKLPVSYQLHEG